MSNEVTLGTMSQILNRSDVGISYSFWGSPYITAGGTREYYDLDEWAGKAYSLEIQRDKRSAMEYMLAGYLVGRIRHLYELADSEVQRAGCITQIFISIRRFASDFLACFEMFSTQGLYEISYLGERMIEIPQDLVKQDSFLWTQTALNERDHKPSEHAPVCAEYTPERVDAIFRKYLLYMA